MGGAGFPMIHGDAEFPEGMPNFLGNFTRGCRIPRGVKFPVTPGKSLGIYLELSLVLLVNTVYL